MILGTLPGQDSLRKAEYYGKEQNAFWPIMGAFFGFDPKAPYAERVACLVQNGVAVWDVCQSAAREGSLDSAIDRASIKPNAIPAFLEKHKTIRAVFFNGQPAAKLFKRFVEADLSARAQALPRFVLPSTSPAHARMNRAEKKRVWQTALYPYFED